MSKVCLVFISENLSSELGHFFLIGIIWSDSSTNYQIAEATVHHIVLAFHMIFINILILNLLIAAFK